MAGIAERRRVLAERQAEVERRLQGHAEERATAATRRERLEAEGAALARLEVLVEQEHARLDGIFESLRHDYQDQVDAVRAGGEKLEQLRQDRHTTEQRLDAVRTRTRTLDLEANEVDLRTEALREHVQRDLGGDARGPGRACPSPRRPRARRWPSTPRSSSASWSRSARSTRWPSRSSRRSRSATRSSRHRSTTCGARAASCTRSCARSTTRS